MFVMFMGSGSEGDKVLKITGIFMSLNPLSVRLTYLAPSLVEWLKFMCSSCNRVEWEQSRLFSSLETHPQRSSLNLVVKALTRQEP